MACLSLPSIAFAPKASNLSLDYSNRSSECLSQIGFGRIKNSRKVRFSVCGALRNIDADDFRHPLDKQNTLIMRAIPGLNEIVKGVLGTIAERFMVLENMGNSVLVSENQAVLAHELGHLKCDHGVWLTVANTFILGAYMVPGLGGLIAQVLEEQLFLWLRAAELTCDRAALLVAQDPKVVVSVIMKLAGGCPSMADQLNVDAFLEQATSYDKTSSSPSGRYIRNAQTRQLTHPLPVLRAREIDEWSRSREFKTLLVRALPNDPTLGKSKEIASRKFEKAKAA